MYRVEYTKFETWIILNDDDEIVFFGTLEQCERFHKRIS